MPTSNGGIHEAVRICDAFGIQLELSPLRAVYCHGWGDSCAEAKDIMYTWYLTVNDVHGRSTVLPFDLMEGSLPLLICLDIKRHSETLNRRDPLILIFKRPMDREAREFHTYIGIDSGGNQRLRIELVTHSKSTLARMLPNITKREPINMAKKVHRFTHISTTDIEAILNDAGYTDPKIREACERVYRAYDVCTSSGRPGISKKMSIGHVN